MGWNPFKRTEKQEPTQAPLTPEQELEKLPNYNVWDFINTDDLPPLRERDPYTLTPYERHTNEELRRIQFIEDKAIDSITSTHSDFRYTGLQERMYPGNDINQSKSGFLKEGEDLRQQLIRDNEFVISRGLTHFAIGLHLLALETLAKNAPGNDGVTVRLNGVPLHIKVINTHGLQLAPTSEVDNDGNITKLDFEGSQVLSISRLDPNDLKKSLQSGRISTLNSRLIMRDGFYQGDVHYRVGPEELIDLLGIDPYQVRLAADGKFKDQRFINFAEQAPQDYTSFQQTSTSPPKPIW